MNEEKLITDFPVTIYGNLEPYNQVLSKGRCRIFYKYGNRNGTYITDEFADKLLATIAYAPVKGIYDSDEKDYTDHGQRRDLGRIYGVVPEQHNLQWEAHMDEDGIERTYACVDVLLYTGLYTEAKEILGKAQSMELYAKSIKGDWQIIEGKRYFVYTDACFLGLQTLGDEVEPCFEGAAFFSMYTALKDLVAHLDEYAQNLHTGEQGGNQMSQVNFKLSDDEKFRALWMLLNPRDNAENDYVVEYDICAVYDDYALVRNYAENCYERVWYVKDDETDSLSITKKELCFIVDVSEEEKEVLDYLRKQGCHTYEQITEHFNVFADLNTKISESDTKIEELNNTISTLTVERDEVQASNEQLKIDFDSLKTDYTKAQEDINTLTTEKDALAAYKKSIEDANKQAVINQYTDVLSAELLNEYSANLEKYSAEDLDMKLTYEVKKARPEIFSHNPQPAYVPKDTSVKSGLEDILARYEKKH